MNVSPLLGGFRHRLPLERVHPGHSSHGSLIQFDGLCRFLPEMFTLKNFVTEVEQSLFKAVDVEVGRSHNIYGVRLCPSDALAVNNIMEVLTEDGNGAGDSFVKGFI